MSDQGGVTCDVTSAAWGSPKPTRPCDSDWVGGRIWLLGAQTTVGGCSTDTVAGAGPVLAYGTGWENGHTRCISRSEGLTCDDLVSGRGFTVSQKRLVLF